MVAYPVRSNHPTIKTMKKTIPLFAIAAVLFAAETKKPTALNDKQRADAAVGFAKLQTATRAFVEARANAEAAYKAAQEAAQSYGAILSTLRKEAGAPNDCLLSVDMAWVRTVTGPDGTREVPCEIQPETKK